MRLFELTGYKNHPVYKAASKLKPTKDKRAQLSAFGRWNSYNVISMDDFTLELKDHGWNLIGEGFYANVYQNPDYPYVVKVFVDDREYLKYFDIVKRNQSNPHVPKIRGNLMKIGTEGYAVRLEPLQRLTGVLDPALRKYVDPRLHPTFNNLVDEENMFFLERKWPQFYEMLMEIFSVTEKLDWHSGNIMKRGDTLVITDPMANIRG